MDTKLGNDRDTTYMSMEPNLHHLLWGYCNPPTVEATDTLEEVYEQIHSCQVGNHHLKYYEDANEIRAVHEWTKCSCWSVYDAVRGCDRVSLEEFTVRKPNERESEGETITATITTTTETKTRQTPTKQELVETALAYHPFDTDEVSAADVEFKCGDISAILALALYYEFGLRVPIVAGAVYNPTTEHGWSHGFLQLTPDQVSDTETRLFLDGTAKQFCDESGFDQTLGAEETIDAVEVLTPSDERFKYYALDRQQVTV